MENNQAIIAKITEVRAIPKADRIQAATVAGYTAVVGIDAKVGDIGVFFQADLQLSEAMAKANNLYRDTTMNEYPEGKAGYLDKNRKIRAQPFKGVKSEGLFSHLEVLAFTGVDLATLEVGNSFNELNGQEVAIKFVSEQTKKAIANAQKQGKVGKKKPECEMFLKHVSSPQFRHVGGSIKKGSLLSFHAKVHGTSARYSLARVKRERTDWKAKIYSFLYGKKLSTNDYEYLVGTRNVIRYQDQNDTEGFHGSEQYRFDILEKLKPFLTKGMTCYGEIAGYANGKPIMGVHKTKPLGDKKVKAKYGDEMTYTYGCVEGTNRFHIYRITMTNEDGVSVDYTDKQVKEFCEANGFIATLDVAEPVIYDGDYAALEAKVVALTEGLDVLGEDWIDPSHLREGIILRVDNGFTTPTFIKNKNFAFKVCEGIAKEISVDYEDTM